MTSDPEKLNKEDGINYRGQLLHVTKNGVKHTGLNLAATDKDAIDFLNG
jgi:hypothetical protein